MPSVDIKSKLVHNVSLLHWYINGFSKRKVILYHFLNAHFFDVIFLNKTRIDGKFILHPNYKAIHFNRLSGT